MTIQKIRGVLLVGLCFFILPVFCVEDNFSFDEPAQRAMFLELTASLRCPMCQNQNIADSDAMIAHDMRRKVYALLKEGKSEQEVIDYMKARYGDFVYYRPPLNAATLWLWALPVLFIGFVAVYLFRKPRKIEVENREEKLKEAEALLKQDDL
ncbi:cytochrome c-type biogenesis protein [Aestuariibacter sp. A3R04]|uniref:cytochrome c-type biogenesis protein n=1 Tax=Aestuariibacter sp. A3R04 TaxID=2841571 RepID=UPI001C083CCA|nr:cytochrome c-type biogenesis protein [Aestuariibacter sp. A3R04]MBU3022086.1 cytochrome c-type biogenesis protein CcmH [Aestuariibacter sp. A3R04]